MLAVAVVVACHENLLAPGPDECLASNKFNEDHYRRLVGLDQISDPGRSQTTNFGQRPIDWIYYAQSYYKYVSPTRFSKEVGRKEVGGSSVNGRLAKPCLQKGLPY